MELQIIQNKIHEIRGQKVMLDFDLAELYGTQTKVLKQAVRRNLGRFPSDFMFELTQADYSQFLRSQTVTLETTHPGRGKYSKYAAFAFTEQGVAMLASILNSPAAISVNIAIVRAFVTLRRYALGYQELAEKIAELEKRCDEQFSNVYDALNLLLHDKQQQADWGKKKPYRL